MQSVQLYNDGRHLEHIRVYSVLCLQIMLLHMHNIHNGFANPFESFALGFESIPNLSGFGFKQNRRHV